MIMFLFLCMNCRLSVISCNLSITVYSISKVRRSTVSVLNTFPLSME